MSDLTKTNPQRLHSDSLVSSSSPLHDRVQIWRVWRGQSRGFSLHNLHDYRQEVWPLEGVSQTAHLIEEAAQSPAAQHSSTETSAGSIIRSSLQIHLVIPVVKVSKGGRWCPNRPNLFMTRTVMTPLIQQLSSVLVELDLFMHAAITNFPQRRYFTTSHSLNWNTQPLQTQDFQTENWFFFSNPANSTSKLFIVNYSKTWCITEPAAADWLWAGLSDLGVSGPLLSLSLRSYFQQQKLWLRNCMSSFLWWNYAVLLHVLVRQWNMIHDVQLEQIYSVWCKNTAEIWRSC